MKTELLYGLHPVREVLSARRRRVDIVYLEGRRTGGRFQPIVALAESQGVRLQHVSDRELTNLVGPVVHQGVAARVSLYPFTKLRDMLTPEPARDAGRFLLMLDNVQDPQNLGALLRTALCVGVDGVILPKDNCAAVTPAVSKASAGALEHICLSRITNLVQTIKQCQKDGFWITGLAAEADRSIYTGDFSGSIGIVLGGEAKGIRPLVRRHCDFLLAIPQQGPVQSLNVSAAGAVVLYEAWRQRQKK